MIFLFFSNALLCGIMRYFLATRCNTLLLRVFLFPGVQKPVCFKRSQKIWWFGARYAKTKIFFSLLWESKRNISQSNKLFMIFNVNFEFLRWGKWSSQKKLTGISFFRHKEIRPLDPNMVKLQFKFII